MDSSSEILRKIILQRGNFYYYYRDSLIRNIFVSEYYLNIINSKNFQRLKRVSFLGAIDYIMPLPNPRGARKYNRFNHSVGVGVLALMYCKKKMLDQSTEKEIVTAALLHDIGHGPLSHTLEAMFDKVFSINHHKASIDLILNKSEINSEIHDLIANENVNVNNVIDYFSTDKYSEHSSLFIGPLNIDTLEAIPRSYNYINRNMTQTHPYLLIDLILNDPAGSSDTFDRFWKMKDDVYNHLINNRLVFYVEYKLKEYLRKNKHLFSKDDFYLDDASFFRKHPAIKKYLKRVRVYIEEARVGGMMPAAKEDALDSVIRHFAIMHDQKVQRPRDFYKRYKQEKSKRKFRPLHLPILKDE